MDFPEGSVFATGAVPSVALTVLLLKQCYKAKTWEY